MNALSRAPTTILIVDDHPALRAGLRSLLSAVQDLAVIADVGSGEEAYLAYRQHQPDVVVMDLSMGGFGGLEAITRIRHGHGDARILVYSVHATDVMLDRALAAGALGYVTKGNAGEVLIQGIREVAGGRGFVSPDLVSALVRRQSSNSRSLLDQLGHTEFQILIQIAGGHSVPACAATLNLSEKTIRNHLTRIKTKLGVSDTAALTLLAVRAGLVEV